jgi:hypothetical protein
MPRAARFPLRRLGRRAMLALMAFLVLAGALASRPARSLMDFDQPFYITIAYDLDRHGVFSNGIFSGVDSAEAAPPAGMFFGPVYPLLVLAAMQIDFRFAAAVRCNVEADRNHDDTARCEPYATPMRIIHALLLALGVLAIAAAGEQMYRRKPVFWLAGGFATIALVAEADIFSFVMTESITFALYSAFALTIVFAWTTARLRYFILAGGLLGILPHAAFIPGVVPGGGGPLLAARLPAFRSAPPAHRGPRAGLDARVRRGGRGLERAQRGRGREIRADAGVRLRGADRAFRL